MESGGPSVPPGGPAAGEYPPPPGAYTPPRPKPGAGWWVAAVAAVVLAALGGLLVGRNAGESSKADDYKAGASGYQAIYDDGFAAGKTEGQEAGTSAGKKAGEQEGAKAGFEKGKEQGQAQGTAEGASAALGGLTDWDTKSHYIVRVAGGPSDEVPYVVSTRTEMQAGQTYALCESDPTVVCVKPQSGSSGE